MVIPLQFKARFHGSFELWMFMSSLSYRLIYWILLGTLTFVSASACNPGFDHRIASSNQSPQTCRIVHHVAGRTCIPLHPQRIVTLWFTSFSNSLALGVKPIASTWIVGQPFPQHLGDATDGVEFAGTLAEPNLEKILRLKPDLIVSNTRLKSINPKLSKIAPTVVFDLPAPPIPLWQKHLEELAMLLNKEQEGQRLVDQYQQRVDDLKAALGDRRHQLQISVVTMNPPYGLFTYGQKHPTSKVLNDIGLQRPPLQRGNFFTLNNISLENLPDIDGDVIFISHRGGESAQEALQKLQQHPLWQTLKAVQNHQIYIVDSNHWYAFDVLAMNAVLDDLEKYLVNTP